MKFAFSYYPVQFYLITISATFAFGFFAAYLSYRDQIDKILPFIMIGLLAPCITAISMIYLSGNEGMIHDFWARLFLFKIQASYLAMIILLMPCVILLATTLSLAFGYSTDQFFLAKEFSVIKGWSILGVFIPFLFAPLIEELGWRGYGVDSLRSEFNLFKTSLIFGILWGLWHLPLFFVKGYYQNQLWNLGIIYVLNFFVSTLVVAFIMNWVYYKTDRSIPAIVLFHSMLNLFSILFRTEPFTKCMATLLLCLVLIVVLVQDRAFFFNNDTEVPTKGEIANRTLDQESYSIRMNAPTEQLRDPLTQERNHRLKSALNLLRDQFHFPGATVSYIFSNGEAGTVATGLADIENEQPMTSDSRMLAASIGKTFVAATVIALAKENRLSLDDPLSKWLGEREWYSRLPNHETITLRHLLTHSGGLPDHVKMICFAELFAEKGLQVNSKAFHERLVGFILDQPPLFEPGKSWSYTDTGYILLGLVIEAVTGNSYYNEVNRRFLKPLNLCHTAPSDQIALPSLAAGYPPANNFYHLPEKTVDDEGVMVWNPGIEWTGGGLISNSWDLARWAKLLYEGKAMPQDYVDDLLQSVPTGDAESKISYGLGVVIEKNGPFGIRYGHLGFIPGYTSSMRYYPQYGVAIAFQINTDWSTSDQRNEIMSKIEERLTQAILSVESEATDQTQI